jgi:extracellular elastinolytic metalloproteinase
MKFSLITAASLAFGAPAVSESSSYFHYPETTVKILELRSLPEGTQESAVTTALETIAHDLNLSTSELELTEQYTDQFGILHVFVDRLINGIQVTNQKAAIHVKNEKVVSFSTSIKRISGGFLQSDVADSTPSISLNDAIDIAEKKFGAKRDRIEPSLVYLKALSGQVQLAYQFQLKNLVNRFFARVSVDANSGEILEVINYGRAAQYDVVKLPKKDPRDGFSTVVDPAYIASSPSGWHDSVSRDTQGNNCFVGINPNFIVETDEDIAIWVQGAATTKSENDYEFKARFNEANPPSLNQESSNINSFYLTNTIHDISYQYGFNEVAGNFQNDNFGKGGLGGDRVVVFNQYTQGTDNAWFYTPPDGQTPIMAMYLFTSTTPNRDGSLDNVIPIHEYTHGITNRMTGGSRQGECLSTEEAGGMGEGVI